MWINAPLHHSVCLFYFHHLITFKYSSSWFGRNLWAFWKYCFSGWFMTFRLMSDCARCAKRIHTYMYTDKYTSEKFMWTRFGCNVNECKQKRHCVELKRLKAGHGEFFSSHRLGTELVNRVQNECFIIQRFNLNNNNFWFNSLADALLIFHTCTPKIYMPNVNRIP